MLFELPKTVTIDGNNYAIRYDYRVIIEIIIMLNDAELDDVDKAEALLTMFYIERPTNVKAAIEKCYEFIDMGETSKRRSPRLLDWEQDFKYIVAPVNRVLSTDIRAIEYDPDTNTGGLHWWSFMAAYMEIGGDCLLSQIISIRNKLARHKKLEKYEKEWLRENRNLVNIKAKYTKQDDNELKKWL